jgi:hypothetical protein
MKIFEKIKKVYNMVSCLMLIHAHGLKLRTKLILPPFLFPAGILY